VTNTSRALKLLLSNRHSFIPVLHREFLAAALIPFDSDYPELKLWQCDLCAPRYVRLVFQGVQLCDLAFGISCAWHEIWCSIRGLPNVARALVMDYYFYEFDFVLNKNGIQAHHFGCDPWTFLHSPESLLLLSVKMSMEAANDIRELVHSGRL
jgi:hypothetical protein